MNIYIITLVKSLLCLCIQSYNIYGKKLKEGIQIIILLLILNSLFILYVKYKSDIFRSRFLRKSYKPSFLLLSIFYTMEISLTVLFYYYYYNLIFIFINFGILLCSYLLRMTEKRKTSPLERNEEFFKIAFIIETYKEDDDIILKKGEVVQILDKKGDNLFIRSSTGQKFTIPCSLVNDDIDLII